jgi:hypothetical protein
VPKRVDSVRAAARFAQRYPEFEKHGRGSRLLAGERLEHGQRRGGLSRSPLRRAKDKARLRVARKGPQHFACLLGRETEILFEKPHRVGDGDVEGTDRVRSTSRRQTAR